MYQYRKIAALIALGPAMWIEWLVIRRMADTTYRRAPGRGDREPPGDSGMGFSTRWRKVGSNYDLNCL